MSENSPLVTMTCPSCSAPLEYNGHSATVRCQFCSTVVAVPKHVRDSYTQKRPTQFPVPPPITEGSSGAEVLEEVKTLLKQDKKIEAIRRYREFFDCSLKQAKISVERMEAEIKGIPYVPPPETPVLSPVSRSNQRTVAAATAGAGFLGCVIPIVIVLFVGGIILFVMLQPGGPFISRLVPMEPAILVSNSETGSPGVVAQVYHVNDEVREIVWLDTGQGKTRWESRPYASNDGFARLVRYGNSLVYVAEDANLYALNASDGSLVWQTTLTDDCVSYEGDLLLVGGRVIVMSVDNNLQAFDAQTGSPAWNRIMQGYDSKVRLAGDNLMVLDYVLNDDSNFEVVWINPADGSEQMILSPVCTERNDPQSYSFAYSIDADDGIFIDEAGNSLYLAFGNSPGCVQRYDLTNGDMFWEAKVEGGFDMSMDDFYSLNTAGKLFFNTGEDLAVIDKEAGSFSFLLADQGYNFLPLALVEGDLILRAKKATGSGGFEIWGVDAESGQISWRYDLGDSDPIDPPNEAAGNVDKGDEAWTYHVSSQGFQLLKFQGEPNQLLVETLDPSDGSTSSEAIIQLKTVDGDFYSIPAILGWQGDVLWVILDGKVVGIDLVAGEEVFHWQ